MRASLLVLHILGGVVAMFAGAAAMSLRKGSRQHRVAGNIFVVSMIVMGTFAVPLALMKHDMNNLLGGVVAIYMVATAWATAKWQDRKAGALDWVGFLFVLAIGGLSVIHGVQKATGRAVDEGVPFFMDLSMGIVFLLAASGDLRMLLQGISGKRRIARHLWRMCFGWFIAAGSFFLGPNNRPLRLLASLGLRQRIFQTVLRQEVLLFLAVLPLLLLTFWMIRVRFTSGYKKKWAPAVPEPSLSVRSG